MTPATLDVLEALMGPDEELYGLKIAQNAGRKAGSVYPILARLEEAGWVESSWEREERGDRGPRRRFYRLVPDGLAAARAPAGRTPRRRPAAHRQQGAGWQAGSGDGSGVFKAGGAVTGGVVGFMVIAIVIPLLVNEAGDLTRSLARCLLRWGARRIGRAEQAERYEEEWLADLERIPGSLTRLIYASGVVVRSVPPAPRAVPRRSAPGPAARGAA